MLYRGIDVLHAHEDYINTAKLSEAVKQGMVCVANGGDGETPPQLTVGKASDVTFMSNIVGIVVYDDTSEDYDITVAKITQDIPSGSYVKFIQLHTGLEIEIREELLSGDVTWSNVSVGDLLYVNAGYLTNVAQVAPDATYGLMPTTSKPVAIYMGSTRPNWHRIKFL